MRTPQRSLVLKEVSGIIDISERLREKVKGSATTGAGQQPMIANPKALHRYIDTLEDNLTQLKVMVQYPGRAP